MAVDRQILVSTSNAAAPRLLREFPGVHVVAPRIAGEPGPDERYYLQVGATEEGAGDLERLPRSVPAVDDEGNPTGDEVEVRPEILSPIVPHTFNTTVRPCPGAYNIGTDDRPGGGTYGGLVWSRGKPYIVSNHHALLHPLNVGTAGAPVYQVSKYYSYPPYEEIGKLHSWTPLVHPPAFNTVDLALVEPLTPSVNFVESRIEGLGTPRGRAPARWFDPVWKSGAASEDTSGTVLSPSVWISFDLGAGTMHFANQIMYDIYAEPGDSGAFVLKKRSGRWRVAGLHFAGHQNGTIRYANRVGAVRRALRRHHRLRVRFRE